MKKILEKLLKGMKWALLVVGVAVILLVSRFLAGMRTYRFFLFTTRTLSEAYEFVTEKISGEPVLADDGQQEAEAPVAGSTAAGESAQPEVYVYVSGDGSVSVRRKELWYYMNRIPGEKISCDVGFSDAAVVVSFVPEYVNGYLYPDGTQEEMPVSGLYAYTDTETGEIWYSKKPYHYKGLGVGRDYELSPNGNPRGVTLRFTAEYESGFLYPDGTQEETY